VSETLDPYDPQILGRMYYYESRQIKMAAKIVSNTPHGYSWINTYMPNSPASDLQVYLENINALRDVAHPTLTADELRIVFAGENITLNGTTYSGWNLFEASRDYTNEKFDNIRALENINSHDSGTKMYPRMTSNGLGIYYTLGSGDARVTMYASRTSLDDDFGTPEEVTGLGTSPIIMASPSSDGQTLHMAKKEGDGTWGIYVSQNGSVSYTADIDWNSDGIIEETLTNVTSPFAATHTYANDGIYDVTVTITDSNNEVVSRTESLTVYNVAPTVAIDGVSPIVDLGDEITAQALVTDSGENNFTYAWTVTDGDSFTRTGTDSTITFTPDSAGDYTVTVTVTDDGIQP
ncbi:MAG: PKD domain-containing protein, partial [Desulfobacterales bacterium]|nr:PKD domain-containing protein [Desulfobacterales bacterium]